MIIMIIMRMELIFSYFVSIHHIPISYSSQIFCCDNQQKLIKDVFKSTTICGDKMGSIVEDVIIYDEDGEAYEYILWIKDQRCWDGGSWKR